MTVGKYPNKVPPAYLIPTTVFASAEDVGFFRDVAPQSGLNVFASAGGVIVDDLAGTGRFDVVTSNFYSCGESQKTLHRAFLMPSQTQEAHDWLAAARKVHPEQPDIVGLQEKVE